MVLFIILLLCLICVILILFVYYGRQSNENHTPSSIPDPKVSIYVLTYNAHKQLEHTIKTWLKHDHFFTKTRNILIDNSTCKNSRNQNADICKRYNIEHLLSEKNVGINRGRLKVAEHFQNSDSDYYIFLEDDMGIHPPIHNLCRCGLTTYVPDLFTKILKIMISSSDLDFLKLSFSEIYMDNNIQVSWYNVPQNIKNKIWPARSYPQCPKTRLKEINIVEGLGYVTGEIYYCNWPLITGKSGNQKMFLNKKWKDPYEQEFMSYMFQLQRKNKLLGGVLLASPILHNRIQSYSIEERRENYE